MGWNYLSIPKLQRWNRWSLGMDKKFHSTLSWACNCFSMLGLKLNEISKWAPGLLLSWTELQHKHISSVPGRSFKHYLPWLINWEFPNFWCFFNHSDPGLILWLCALCHSCAWIYSRNCVNKQGGYVYVYLPLHELVKWEFVIFTVASIALRDNMLYYEHNIHFYEKEICPFQYVYLFCFWLWIHQRFCIDLLPLFRFLCTTQVCLLKVSKESKWNQWSLNIIHNFHQRALSHNLFVKTILHQLEGIPCDSYTIDRTMGRRRQIYQFKCCPNTSCHIFHDRCLSRRSKLHVC